ncbi:MAG TPA: cobyrinate a,c-diamide synthase [bacterium]|nr:cobyrinate a,c-diamide synthase [bacterium]
MPSPRGPRRLVIAGVASGVGKTTVTGAIIAAMRRRGRRVQPFKAGPDYIDPTYHTLTAGRACRNLDSVLLGPETLRTLFARAAQGADLALVEGVMGLFDGRIEGGDQGSTAEIARLLGAPVLVVIDVARTARTAGAVALGCVRFDPRLAVAGFILNRVGSPAHAQAAAAAVEAATQLPVLGALPRDDGLALPERHLGLVPTVESGPDREFLERLVARAESHLAIDRIWDLAGEPHEETVTPDESLATPVFPPEPMAPRATIAIAQDRAFNFYYQDSLDLLQAWGGSLAPFSPLEDPGLPRGTQGVYLGGGFPELYAAELAENRPMLDALRRAAAAGLPLYGECGGLMYLGRTLTDLDGRRYPMAGLAPVDSVMRRERVTIGYRTATALRASPILPAGAEVRGHEFHYSQLSSPVPEETAAYRMAKQAEAKEGFVDRNVLASYLHVHFGSDPAMARRFVQMCARTPRV